VRRPITFLLVGCRIAQGCEVGAVIRDAVEPILKQYDVAGMSVAVTHKKQQLFFNFGVASKESGAKVTENTIFEIGSISKIFTATMAAYAESTGKLSLKDPASRHLPELAGTAFDEITLLDLLTYTPGGLPLQFPDNVTNPQEMIAFYRNWRPEHATGTMRRYSNPSIGLAGHAAAKSMGKPFAEILQQQLFPMLGLSNTFVEVPQSRLSGYAYGYNTQGKPIRVTPGVLDAEAYGVKITAKDLIGFMQKIIDPSLVKDPALRKAIDLTRRGYYRIGGTTQALGWEMYDWPVTLDALVAGNSPDMALKSNPAQAIALPARDRVLLNKTGSTNGFGAYVAVVPERKMGVVLLANKNYPNAARVAAAHKILDACGGSK
jgi:beta-lactamase class C